MHIPKYFVAAVALSSFVATLPVGAQNAGKQNSLSTWKVTGGGRFIATAKGVRYEGSAADPVRLQSPDLNVTAPLVTVDRDERQSAISNVTARNGVQLKLGRESGTGLYIEAKSQTATLDLVPVKGRRTLTLAGNISGFYRSNGARNTLSGSRAVVSFGSGGDVQVNIEGGNEGVRLEFSGLALGGADNDTKIIVTARDASTDRKTGITRLTGNARAVSQYTGDDAAAKERANAFDIAAPSFVITTVEKEETDARNRKVRRSRFDSLRSEGRATLKLSLPPSDEQEPSADAPTASSNAAGDNNEENAVSLRPTYLESAADRVSWTQPESPANTERRVVVLEGNVSGFYRVAPPKPDKNAIPTAAQIAAQTARANQQFAFSGDKATITANTVSRPRRSDDPVPPAPAKPSATVTNTEVEFEFNGRPGQPVSTEIPGFDLGFGTDDSADETEQTTAKP